MRIRGDLHTLKPVGAVYKARHFSPLYSLQYELAPRMDEISEIHDGVVKDTPKSVSKLTLEI